MGEKTHDHSYDFYGTFLLPSLGPKELYLYINTMNKWPLVVSIYCPREEDEDGGESYTKNVEEVVVTGIYREQDAGKERDVIFITP